MESIYAEILVVSIRVRNMNTEKPGVLILLEQKKTFLEADILGWFVITEMLV